METAGHEPPEMTKAIVGAEEGEAMLLSVDDSIRAPIVFVEQLSKPVTNS